MLAALGLSATTFAYLIATVFVAGVVRGFTGFAASAVVMATGTLVLAPLDLLPICLLLEIVASVFLVRGGIKDADIKLVIPMIGFAFAALPFGLYLTQGMDPERSKLIALALVGGLAALQLARVPLPLGRGILPAAIVGSLAGLIQGLASVGGLVQALYVVALKMQARTMRGTMILGVMISGAIGLFWQLAMGVMTMQALMRVAGILLPYLFGLWLGRRYFTPENERYYRPISLSVLVMLAGAGVLKQLFETLFG
ncbi:sulfite exporter TauE/SafE family protein [Thalassovita sp.]|uniref:sulfite exporter TauE/SafE family protein n=1 Tax=Thalassovita sp. TaxID=1979401 RepID=UPI0029DE5CCA|nr:sulfite exporter TauE/SafE family protein [Thalassovita sp.]